MSLRKYLLGLGALAGLGITILAVNACLLTDDPRYCPGAPENTCSSDGDAMPPPDAPSCTPGMAGMPDSCDPSSVLPICGSEGFCISCLGAGNDAQARNEACVRPGLCDDGDPNCICLTSGRCGICSSHEDCVSGICNAGECVAESDITYVSKSGGNDTTCAPGSLRSPCLTVAEAYRKMTNWIHIAPDIYTESVEFTTARKVRIVGAAKTNTGKNSQELGVTLRPASQKYVWKLNGAGVEVEAEGIVFENVDVFSGANVLCEQGKLALTRTRLQKGRSGVFGLSVLVGCSATVQRSEIRENGGGGIDIASTLPVVLTNNLIVNNGSSNSLFGGVRVSGEQVTLQFNTIANNGSRLAGARGIDCISAPVMPYNNIVYNPSADPAANELIGCDATVFENAKSLVGIDPKLDDKYHLTAESTAAIDMAQSIPGVDIDFDGDPRPNGDSPDIGADELVP